MNRYGRISSLFCFFLWAWTTSSLAMGGTQKALQEGERPLPPNKVIERTLGSGDTHSYKVRLKAGEYFHVDVEQRGVNVLLLLFDSTGKQIVRRDRPNGANGQESLSFLAISRGDYRLDVTAPENKTGGGKYDIARTSPRAPTPSDRKRIEAENLLEEGQRLNETSTEACEKYEAAAALWQGMGDKYAEALTRTLLGYTRYGLKEYEKAVAAHERASLLFRELKNKEYEAVNLVRSYTLNFILLKPDLALAQYRQAKALYQGSKDFNNEQQLDKHMATLAGKFLDTGRDLFRQRNAAAYRSAVQYFGVSQAIYHELGDKRNEASSLLALGRINSDLGEKQKALDLYEKALPLMRKAEYRAGEAATLNNIGSIYSFTGKKTQALGYFNQALSLYTDQSVGSKFGKAAILNSIGSVYSDTGDKRKALDYFENQALPLMREAANQSGEAVTLINIGDVYAGFGDKKKALDYYENKALPLAIASKDQAVEASIYNKLGRVRSDLGDKQKALEYFEGRALPLLRGVGDESGEATTFNNIGGVYYEMGDNRKALDYYENKALPLMQALGNKSGEASTLNNIGQVYSVLGDKRKALDYFENRALPLMVAAEDRAGEAKIFNNIGQIYFDLGDNQKALDYFENKVLPLMLAIEDKSGEASALINIGSVYSDLDDKNKALDYFENRALPLIKAAEDKAAEAAALNNIGRVYAEIGENQKALDYYQKGALPLVKNTGNKLDEAMTLNNIGTIYAILGEMREALNYYEDKALPLMREVGSKPGEATTLNNIAATYYRLGQNQKALDYYENKVLPLERETEDKLGEATALNNIGCVYSSLGEHQKSLDYYLNKALPLMREVRRKSNEASILGNIGTTYSELGEPQRALDYFNRAVPLYRASGDKQGEANTLNNLMDVWDKLKNPRLAIFYGKLSANAYQQLRYNNQKLDDNEVRKAFLKSFDYTYRYLVKLLIEQARLGEALQVFNAFKDQQYFDFDRATLKKPSPLKFTQRETDLASSYTDASGLVADYINRVEDRKRAIAETTPALGADAELHQLESGLQEATSKFSALVKEAEKEFNQPPDAVKDKTPYIEDADQIQTALRTLNEKTKQKAIALYTLVGEDNFWALLVTDQSIIPVIYAVKGEELNKKAKEFLVQLSEADEQTEEPRHSQAEVKIKGKELFDLVFAPIAARLRELNIKPDVLMWSLDRGLRYVPMAALYDGKQYLAERYRNVVFTRADPKRMLSPVGERWAGWGFYNSREYVVPVHGEMKRYPALKNAKSEVETIFGVPPVSGIIKGQCLSDTQFSQNAFLERLQRHQPLVHIASHFKFVPGDADASFLLLGNGETLTLAEIKKEPDDLFGGVELLTLSACETGAQKERESDGREIDSFAELAQRKGAQAILASLWEVDDQSTSRLMRAFYQKRQSNNLTKAEALQRAQLSLLTDSNYSHPFYWAPFVLTGNWR